MDLEVFTFEAKDGDAAAAKAALDAGPAESLAACDGCRKVTTMTGVESPGKVLMLIEWDSVAAHEAAKESESFASFAAVIGPLIGGDAAVEHFR